MWQMWQQNAHTEDTQRKGFVIANRNAIANSYAEAVPEVQGDEI